MDEFNENIIDENIQILTPKNSQFLLNKMNMFAMTERKVNKNKKDPYKKELNDKINKKYITQIQSIDEDRNEDLKTIIKDPEILTINRIIEIRNIMRANSNNDVKKHTQNLEKNKKNNNNDDIKKMCMESLIKKGIITEIKDLQKPKRETLKEKLTQKKKASLKILA
jgi:hypothetical protein